MSQYYVFKTMNSQTFVKLNSLKEALMLAKESGVVYQKVKDIPNPWYVHPVENGKVNKKKILYKTDTGVKDVTRKYL